jgi:hypothetical protein
MQQHIITEDRRVVVRDSSGTITYRSAKYASNREAAAVAAKQRAYNHKESK